MEILWNWNSEIQLPNYTGLNLLQNDILHEITFNSHRQLQSYKLTKYPHTLPNNAWMEWDTPASIVPTAFEQVNVFQKSLMTHAPLDDKFALQFLAENHPPAKSHFMQLLWPHAVSSSANSPFSVFAWYHQNQFILFAFEQNTLLIGNTYRVNNPQECLYFTLLPFHNLKLKPSELKVTLFSDFESPQGSQTKQVFTKLIPHTQFSSQLNADIFKGNNPPMSHFVSFLINAQSCALPVEI